MMFQLTWQVCDDLAGQVEHILSLRGFREKQPNLDDRADLVKTEVELGDDAEVAAATANGPEQVRVLIRSRSLDRLAIENISA